MTEQEFWDLESQWEDTSEYQEYEAYCDKYKSSQNEEEIQECWRLFWRALDNGIGKQLRSERQFWRIIMG
jgi:hypothetical protein